MGKVGEIPLGYGGRGESIPIYDSATVPNSWVGAGKNQSSEVKGYFFLEPIDQAYFAGYAEFNHPQTGEPYAPSILNPNPEPGTKVIEDFEDNGAYPPGWTLNTLSKYTIDPDARYYGDYGAYVQDGDLGSEVNDGLDWYCGWGEADRFYFIPDSGDRGDTFETFFIIENGSNYYSVEADFWNDRVTFYRADGGDRQPVVRADGTFIQGRRYRIEAYTGGGRLRLFWADVNDTFYEGADPHYYAFGSETGHIHTEDSPAVSTDRRHPFRIRANGRWGTDDHEAFDINTSLPAPFP